MLTDEQELIRSAVREWAELNLAPIAQELDRHPANGYRTSEFEVMQ